MSEFDVTICVKVTKTYRILAVDVDSAEEQAHQIFNFAYDGVHDDSYDQDVVEIVEVTNDES